MNHRMRNRTIKPEFWQSFPISRLSLGAQLTFIGLWNYADDHGREVTDPRLIRSELWALHPEVTADDVAGWMREIIAQGLIVIYRADGYELYQVRNWSEHQHVNRPKPSRYPAPPRESLRPAAVAPSTKKAVTDESLTRHGTISDGSLTRHGGVTDASVSETASDAGDHPPGEITDASVTRHGGVTDTSLIDHGAVTDASLTSTKNKPLDLAVTSDSQVEDPPPAPIAEPRAPASRSRAEGTNPRAQGTNPRAEGTNPRATGDNPRAEGTNPRARDPLFDALALAEGSDPYGMTRRGARAVGVALAEIKGASPDVSVGEIVRRAHNWPTVFPSATITASAIAKHWSRLAVPGESPNGRAVRDPAAEIMDRARERARIEALEDPEHVT